MWICPSCKNEIDYLQYTVDARENGHVSLYNREGSCDTGDYESESGEWQGPIDYSCPECYEQINFNDLTPADKEKEEEEEEELEEEKHKIIKPEIKLQIEKEYFDQIENTMICKYCFYAFVYSNEDFIDCPNCGQQNNEEEYKKLITDRFFEKIKIKKLRKKYAKKTKNRRIKPVGQPRKPIRSAL